MKKLLIALLCLVMCLPLASALAEAVAAEDAPVVVEEVPAVVEEAPEQSVTALEEVLLPAEGSMLLWIQDHLRTGFMTPIWLVITRLGDKGILWIVLTLVLLAIRKTRRLGVFCAASMVIGLLVTNLVIKNWVARIRPYDLVQGLECLVGVQKDFSFPSGHTTNSLACAWVLFKMTPKKYGVPALVMAVLIALSRLYVGVHYPTDVLGGAVIGICSAVLAMKLVPVVEKKIPAVKKLY